MPRENEVHLDKQDTDEVFLRFNQLEGELLEIKNMLSLALAGQHTEVLKKAA